MSQNGRILTRAEQIKSYISTMSKGFTTDEEFDRRQEKCSACPKQIEKKGIKYCEACGCAMLPAIALRYKNTRSGWKCPIGEW